MKKKAFSFYTFVNAPNEHISLVNFENIVFVFTKKEATLRTDHLNRSEGWQKPFINSTTCLLLYR